MTWREHSVPIITAVIQKYGTNDMKLLRRKLREAYPYGERENYPYKIWRDEIKRQLRLNPYDKTRERRHYEHYEQYGQLRMEL